MTIAEELTEYPLDLPLHVGQRVKILWEGDGRIGTLISVKFSEYDPELSGTFEVEFPDGSSDIWGCVSSLEVLHGNTP